jgi:hypothetical protein
MRVIFEDQLFVLKRLEKRVLLTALGKQKVVVDKESKLDQVSKPEEEPICQREQENMKASERDNFKYSNKQNMKDSEQENIKNFKQDKKPALKSKSATLRASIEVLERNMGDILNMDKHAKNTYEAVSLAFLAYTLYF